jgi:phage/plasmid-like protein (TIGR03299 family)
MSHEITATDNTFSVREMPWMGLLDGQVHVLPEYPTRAEAQKLVHDWEPVTEPLFRKVPKITPDGDLITEYVESTTGVGVLRSDSGAELATVSPTFELVTNSEMYDVGEAIQGEGVDVRFETGGSLFGGKKVWLALRMEEPIVIDGDPHGTTLPFFVLQNSHDASGAFRGQATFIRPVCANTTRAADLDAKMRGTEFKFRHTSGVANRIEEAKAALAGWRTSVDEWTLLMNSLTELKVTDEGVQAFLDRLLPYPPEHLMSLRTRNNVERDRGDWMSAYNSVTNEGIGHSAYGLVQVTSEWSEHYRRAHNAETRFNRAMLVRNDVMTGAVKLARQAALV